MRAEEYDLIKAAIDAAQAKVSPPVVEIRWTLREDSTGEPSAFLLVVMAELKTEEAWLEDSLRVGEILQDAVFATQTDRFPYLTFRTPAEQAELDAEDVATTP